MPPKSSKPTEGSPTETSGLSISQIQAKLLKKFPQVYQGSNIPPTEFIPTGHVGLDYLMGGGVPMGRVVELLSKTTNVGKSSCALYMAAAVQKATGKNIYICDSEHCIDQSYLVRLGVDLDNVVINRTASLNEALDFYTEVLENPAYGCCAFIFDTVKGFLPDKLQEKLKANPEAASMASAARVWSQNRSELINLTARCGCVTICVNHVSTSLDPYAGSVLARSGGKAIPEAASLTLVFKGGGKTVADDLKGLPGYKGLSAIIEVDKSRFGTKLLSTTVDLIDTGYDPISSLARLAKQFGIAKGSAWIDLEVGPDQYERINGFAKLYQYLEANPQAAEWVRARVLLAAHSNKSVEVDVSEEVDE